MTFNATIGIGLFTIISIIVVYVFYLRTKEKRKKTDGLAIITMTTGLVISSFLIVQMGLQTFGFPPMFQVEIPPDYITPISAFVGLSIINSMWQRRRV